MVLTWKSNFFKFHVYKIFNLHMKSLSSHYEIRHPNSKLMSLKHVYLKKKKIKRDVFKIYQK